MRIEDIIWLESVTNKLAYKHNVRPEEVEQVLRNKPIRIQFIQRGDYEDEDVYSALGRTDEGRYLIVIFVYKQSWDALILSAPERKGHDTKGAEAIWQKIATEISLSSIPCADW
jgi:uncharacterized protein